jgi:hypothetical protein
MISNKEQSTELSRVEELNKYLDELKQVEDMNKKELLEFIEHSILTVRESQENSVRFHNWAHTFNKLFEDYLDEKEINKEYLDMMMNGFSSSSCNDDYDWMKFYGTYFYGSTRDMMKSMEKQEK